MSDDKKNDLENTVKQLIDKVKTFDYKKLVSSRKYVIRVGLVALGIAALLQTHSCLKARPKKEVIQPRPVQTAIAIRKDVPVYINSFGTLTAFNNVDVKAQATGKILEVHFVEGDIVKEGDLLFVIDPSEYKAELDKAEAQLDQDLAILKLSEDTLERNRPLFEKGLLSAQDFETYETSVAEGVANVELDKAAVELAKINLDYCYVKALVPGKTGKRLLDVGNLVQVVNAVSLVNIKTIDELYLDFTVPERYFPDVRKSMEDSTLKVEVTVDGDSEGPYEGKVSFLDNTINESTGTVALRAIVPNTKNKLLPGQFVHVSLILRIAKKAVLVPYAAVQIGQQGDYLFVVIHGKAEIRTLTIGQREGDMIVIKKGVKGGERVVTVGQLGLGPGIPVVDVTKEVEARKKKK